MYVEPIMLLLAINFRGLYNPSFCCYLCLVLISLSIIYIYDNKQEQTEVKGINDSAKGEVDRLGYKVYAKAIGATAAKSDRNHVNTKFDNLLGLKLDEDNMTEVTTKVW